MSNNIKHQNQKCYKCGNTIKNNFICCDNDCGVVFCSDICSKNDNHKCLVEDDSVDIPDDIDM